MTRGAAISIALLALIALVLIMLLGRHGSAANSPPGASYDGALLLTRSAFAEC
jgi:hypothetical protein